MSYIDKLEELKRNFSKKNDRDAIIPENYNNMQLVQSNNQYNNLNLSKLKKVKFKPI